MERRYLSPKELVEYSGFGLATIYKWIKLRKIPFIKKSRLVKFDKMAVDEWLARDNVKSLEEYEKMP